MLFYNIYFLIYHSFEGVIMSDDNMFYTSVVQQGQNLIHRYIKNGKRHSEYIKDFEYDLYIKSDYSNDSMTVYNEPLKKYVFSNIQDMNSFIKENGQENVYGNTDPVSQFIAKTYPNTIKLTNDYVVLNFDLEVEHGSGIPKYEKNKNIRARVVGTYDEFDVEIQKVKEIKQLVEVYDIERDDWIVFNESCYAPKSLGFPDPNLAIYEVMSVSLIASHDKNIYVFGTKDFTGDTKIHDSEYVINYTRCKDERELLIRFIQKWRDIKPDIITGWNIERFDVPYIINRITRVLGKKFTNMLSPYSQESTTCIKERQKEDAVYYSIAGINIYDYINIYKKFSRSKQESYRLDWIGAVEVNHKKVSFPEYDNSLMKLWEYDFNKFILYNAIDTLIVNKIEDKLKYINLAITIAHITKSDLSDATGTIKIWDNLIYNMLSKKNIQIPPHIKKEKGKGIIGAYVKDPLLGRHGWTLTFDLTSLYPSIIRQVGMSPETIRIREVGHDLMANREYRVNIMMNQEIVDDIISRGKFGNDDSDVTDEIMFASEYDDEMIDNLRKCTKNKLLKIRSGLNAADEYYNSGHPYIHGTKDVLENIDNMIEFETDLQWAKDNNLSVAGNGSAYDKSIEGVIPAAMTYLFNYRVELKSEMKKQKKKLQSKIEELHKLES